MACNQKDGAYSLRIDALANTIIIAYDNLLDNNN